MIQTTFPLEMKTNHANQKYHRQQTKTEAVVIKLQGNWRKKWKKKKPPLAHTHIVDNGHMQIKKHTSDKCIVIYNIL